ncbi:AraC-type DNA-binding protein [Paenibacillus uliginis N3/975]|uniref:AraC-type DNA-binding protein n=1 Tax=Paenibacillus uliginis N3/975 TaxID=1313296 RepID=A0A1X7GY12_9BACL|nr:helix-turn-helix domain-containing protein [Paenibacillus uliginis]SMF76001.1 AraC-type DNA-binding protein [Paenibacillus uliginis N3/975]
MLKRLLRPLGFRNLRSVWMTMLISNLVLLLIPVSMGAFLYTKVEASLQNEANRSNQAMLEQLKLSLDSKLNEVKKLAQQIVFDPKLEYLLKLNEDQNSPDRYKFIEFMRDTMSRPGNITNFILDYYVYFRNSDLVLKSGLLTDSHKFYDMYYSYQGMSYEQWREGMLTSFHTMAYLPSATLLRRAEYDPMQSIQKTPLNVITFTQSLPGRDRSDITGSFVILIDESQIKAMFAQIESASDSSIYIVDGDGRTIMASDKEPLPSQLLSRINGNGGLFNQTLNGDPKVISYTPSQEEGWKYVLVTPRSVFMQQVILIKNWTIILFALCLTVGLSAAFIFTYRNYSPLRRAVNTILRGKNWSGKPSVNEYDFILQTIEGSLHEEKTLRSMLAQQTPVIRSNYLSRLIRGQMDVDTSEKGGQALMFMDISFVSDYFAVIVVQLDSILRFNEEQSEEMWALARFIVSNIGMDIIQEPHKAFAVELDHDRVALLNNFSSEQPENAEQVIKEMSESLKNLIEQRFKIDITVAVGLPHVGAKSVGESYAEAVAALEYRIIKGGGTIIYFQDITNVHSHYYYPIDIEVQLINFVRSGDMENVLKLLDTIYMMNFESGSITPEFGRCLFFNITSTFLKIINSTGTDQHDILGRDIDLVKDIFSYETAEGMQQRIKKLYELLTESLVTDRTDHCIQLLQDMEQFLEENFTDPNMGLGMMAERFEMTPQYVSTFYKKHSGINLSDYIARKRIELAKQHMCDKDLTNARIALLVGYTSDVVFIRAFKKLEGVTPGRYRENMLSYASDDVG